MKQTIRLLGLALVMSGAWSVASAEPVAIKNDSLQVSVDQAAGTFAIQAKGLNRPVAGNFVGGAGSAKAAKVSDKIFGEGDCIELAHANGDRDSVLLFPSLPFVLFKSALHNAGTEAVVTNHVRTVSVQADLGKEIDQLRAFGTGGIQPVAKSPGSYAYLVTVDPESRHGVVCGWLTHDRGSGVMFPQVRDGKAWMDAQIDYGRLRIKPGQDAETETLAIGYFEDARVGLESWADAIARQYSIKLLPQQAGYCTWYAEKHGGAADEKSLAELSAFAAKELKPFGFNFVQIDDMWQKGKRRNGPAKDFTTHAPDGPYPSGMKPTADTIKSLGLVPGIWFMPFAGDHEDPYFKDHPEWFAHLADGKPFETPWGGTSLDLTQPGAKEHVRSEVARIAHDWGYTLFKMDGMWTGSATRQIYVNDGYRDDAIGEAVFSDPDKTNIEAFRDGLKLVRQAAGPDVFLLGCCVSQNMRSFGGTFGLLDAMRVGPDTGAGHIGARHGSREYFLHGRVWWNDPDCVSVRKTTPLDQARVNASFVAITGQLFYNSDWLPELPTDRLEIMKRTLLGHGLKARPVDYFENDPPRIWLLSDSRQQPRRDVVALFNWGDKSIDIDCSLARIGLEGESTYVGFDFWANAFVPPVKGSLKATLPKHSCRILSLRPLTDHPQLVSTSRHVTQGIVDLLEEKWDGTASCLSGRSKLIGSDPYELRILAQAADKGWAVESAEVTAGDKATGVKIAAKEFNGFVRVTIESAADREVAWSVRFRSGGKKSVKPEPVAELKGSAAERGPVLLTWNGGSLDGVSYEIRRDDTEPVTTSATQWADDQVKFGKNYRYQVTSVDWSGNRSESREVSVTTPKIPELPPLPPKPQVSITTLKPLKAKTGHGQVTAGKSAGGKPLKIGKKTYPDGVGVHAVSELVYDRKAEWKRFVAVAGLDEAMRSHDASSVIVKVVSDNGEAIEPLKTLAVSPTLRFGGTEYWHFNVELPADCRKLHLMVEDAGDGINSDHLDWVEAGFITAEK